jgi:hypothetical protein
MVTPGLIMYPVMEDQFPSLPRDATARLRPEFGHLTSLVEIPGF